MTTKVHVELLELHHPVKVTVEMKHHDGSWREHKVYFLLTKEDKVHEYVHGIQRLVIEEAAQQG